MIILPVGWLLFGSGTLAALLIAAADRVVADARQRERIALRLYEREFACAAAVRAGTGQQVRAAAPATPVLEGAQVASLGDLRRRIRAGEFADDTASVEQARLRWARWGVAHGVFGEQPREEPEPPESGQPEDAEEASDAPPTR